MSEGKGKKAARERAMAKAMAMSVLFQKDNYAAVTNVLDKIDPDNPDSVWDDFRKACTDAKLDNDDIVWLWNYLKRYDKNLAKSSDDKWPVVAEATSYHW